MAPKSVFIEQAAAEVAAETVFAGEQQADSLLKTTRAHIYHWAPSFQGFESTLKFFDGAEHHSANFRASESRRIEVRWEDEFDHRWVRFQLEELISHREAPERSKMASQTGCRLEDEHPVYGTKIAFIGDKMGSFYRIKNNRITQIGRAYGKMEFIINIDAHHNFGTASEPRYAAANYTAFYWSKDTGELMKTETYEDKYKMVDGVPLPLSRQVTIAQSREADGFSVRLLEFSDHKLLQQEPKSQERE